jgi:hypothetical protein
MAKADGHEVAARMRLEAAALAGSESARSVRADCRPSSAAAMSAGAKRTAAFVDSLALAGSEQALDDVGPSATW